jgi:hypothetical protein
MSFSTDIMNYKENNRFWSKVEVTESCWVWRGVKTTHGYGAFGLNYKIYRAHKISYELINGKIMCGLVLDHLCRNKLCVNPDHLEPVTVRENTMRGVGVTAKNAKKKYCKNNHPLFGDNSYVSSGARRCRKCINSYYLKLKTDNYEVLKRYKRDKQREYRLRKKLNRP